MIIKQIPFNPETAQNGDVLVHRDLGKVVYIGQHPAQKERCVIWDRVDSCLSTVNQESVTKEVEMVEKWVNLSTDLYNGGLIPSKLFNTKELAEVSGRHTIEYVCTVPIMVPKV